MLELSTIEQYFSINAPNEKYQRTCKKRNQEKKTFALSGN